MNMRSSQEIDALSQRPELLLGPNPFIERIPGQIVYADFATKLPRLPLADVDWQSIPPSHREPFLNFASKHFVPHRELFEPASGIQTLLRRAMVLINPLTPGATARVTRIALCQSPQEMMRLPSLDGAGTLWDGITGTGRSALMARTLELLVPEQTLEYGPSQVCGWTRLLQAVYLYVDQPSNGSRGGLLQRILFKLDTALGTSYSDDYKRMVNLDKLLVVVCSLLALHRVCLLVIDENQQKNFGHSPWHEEFVLFYLSVMNMGISVALVGNPLAFVNLKAFMQPLRRLSVGGIHHFQPAADAMTPSWDEDFAPRMRQFKVVETCTISPARRREIEFEHTAGLHGLFAPLHTQAQRIALRRGGSTSELREGDFTDASKSAAYRELRQIADAVRNAKPSKAALRFRDLPSQDFTQIEPPGDPANEVDKALPSITPDQVDVIKALLRTHKSNQTRQDNVLLKRLETLSSLDPAQLEALGVSEKLLGAARELRDKRSSEKGAKAEGKPRS